MLYFKGTNTGKGFITHADHESFEVYSHGNIFVTDSGSLAEAWGVRNGLESITKEAAQTIVDAAVEANAIEWDNLPAEDKEGELLNVRPETAPLP
tara:strand:+ start:510 stop:794 length:285 start_codon:yes stop_codon:yes gene_type:complete